VTAGVAFLAAGTIILSQGEVRGLTTGARMWLAGAIGLALGLGHWLIAAFALAAGLMVLYAVGKLENTCKSKPASPTELMAHGKNNNRQPKS